MRAALPFSLCLVLSACSARSDDVSSRFYEATCETNEDCGSGQVCFANGCGDPGKDLVAEVLVSSQYGHLEQDFGGQNLDLQGFTPIYAAPAMTVEMKVSRPLTPGGEPAPYPDRITLRAQGMSDQLPGIRRTYSTTTATTSGLIRMPIGAGTFELSATPLLETLPPKFISKLQVGAGESKLLSVVFPHPDDLFVVDGQIVKLSTGPVLLGAEQNVDVQVLDADSLKPLSQRVQASATGQFRVFADASLRSKSEMIVSVVPRDPKSTLPSKQFLVSTLQRDIGRLELGDFGVPLVVSGTAVSSANNHLITDAGVEDTAPIAGATVLIEGTVRGGGSFKSQTAVTDGLGRFSLNVLPSNAVTGSLSLTVIPPAGHFSRAFTRSVAIEPKTPGAPVELGPIQCPDRVAFAGIVLTPSGTPAAGVRVSATGVLSLQNTGESTYVDGLTTVTDTSGKFTLLLDPAVYRFDLVASSSAQSVVNSAEFPLTSRFVTIEAEAGLVTGTGTKTPPTREFVLSPGKRFSGKIFTRDGNRGDMPAPYATIRLFRVGTSGGMPISVELAQGISDQNGNYTLLMPTR